MKFIKLSKLIAISSVLLITSCNTVAKAYSKKETSKNNTESDVSLKIETKSNTNTRHTNHVVLISIDGLMPKVLLNTNTPKLNSQWKRGSYSFNAKTIVPSLTLPSHISMLTGVTFERHQVYWNDYEPSKFIPVKTIFEIAKEYDLKTSAFVSKEKFKHFNRNKTPDIFFYPGYDYKKVLNGAEESIIKEKPNFSFVHLAEVDGMGHTFGWESGAQKSMIEEMDPYIGKFVDKILKEIDDSIIIITSDHGGHLLFHGSDSKEDTTIPWIVRGNKIKSNYEIKENIITYDTTATSLWLLGVKIDNIDGKPIKEILVE